MIPNVSKLSFTTREWLVYRKKELDLGNVFGATEQKNLRSSIAGSCPTAYLGMMTPKACAHRLSVDTTDSDSRSSNQHHSSIRGNDLAFVLFPCFSPSIGFSTFQWQPNEVLQLSLTFYVMIAFFLLFVLFSCYFSAPSGTKGKLFPISFQSSPELANCACLHDFVRSVLFMTSEMVFLLQLQKPEVGQEQKGRQTPLSVHCLPAKLVPSKNPPVVSGLGATLCPTIW